MIETLTGFKYIGEKMHDYEKRLGESGGSAGNGGETPGQQRARALEKSRFVVFGGEESYGYTGGDYVRDKDGNAAVLMFAEAAAYAKIQGQTLVDYLDAIYRELGFYTERLGTLTLRGRPRRAADRHPARLLPRRAADGLPRPEGRARG